MNFQPEDGDEVWTWNPTLHRPRKMSFDHNWLLGMKDQLARGELFPTKETCQADHDRRINGCKWKWSLTGLQWNTSCGAQYNPSAEIVLFGQYSHCPNCGGRIVEGE